MKILVIEDDIGLMEQLCGWLEENGYQTLNAKDEQMAEDMLMQYGDLINIALVDMYLSPKENGLNYRESGLRLIQLITTKYPFLDTIVNTGNADFENSMKCMEAGAFSYIIKGESPDRLLNAIQRAEEKQGKNRQLLEAMDDFRTDLKKVVDLLHKLMGGIQRIQDEYQKTPHRDE
jgi:DNA-binding NtrC family response regulator